MFSGEQKNVKAILLEDYWKKVTQADLHSKEEPVRFEEISNVKDLQENPGKLDEFDTIILNMKQSQPDLCMELMNKIVRSDKPNQCALMIFPSEILQFENISCLRNNSLGQMEKLKIVPIYFNDSKQTTDNDVVENLVFGILFGRFSVLISPLKMAYSNLSQTLHIIQSVCPPKSKVALITEAGLPMIQIHSPELLHQITYFGSKGELSKFQLMLSKDKTLHNTQSCNSTESDKSSTQSQSSPESDTRSAQPDSSPGQETSSVQPDSSLEQDTSSAQPECSLEQDTSSAQPESNPGSDSSSVLPEIIKEHVSVPVSDESTTSPVKSHDSRPSFDNSQDSGIGSPGMSSSGNYSVSTSYQSRMKIIDAELDQIDS